MRSNALIQIVCFMLILLFAYAGFSKLADHSMFYIQLLRMPWLSVAAGFIAWVLPLLEIAIVLLLFFPSTLIYGLYTSFCLIIMFVLFLIIMVMFTTNLPCSCGGIIAKLSWTQHIIFNLFFLLLNAVGIILHQRISKQSISI